MSYAESMSVCTEKPQHFESKERLCEVCVLHQRVHNQAGRLDSGYRTIPPEARMQYANNKGWATMLRKKII
jgi:hypothetical protein